MLTVSRRLFVTASSAALAAPLVRPRPAVAALRWMGGGLPDSFPAHDPDLVRTVVGKAHVDYDAVRHLVTARPALAKAAWDWGFGDWESALGAASHMGRRDIAELLIEHGARPNLFTFAMLGQVDAVRAICRANPGLQGLHGPHGIPLLDHARMGGTAAAGVVAYLEQLGGADVGQTTVALDEQAAQPYVGGYEPAIAAGVVFRIGYHDRRGVLTFQRDERPARFLMHLGDHVFAPSGGASVRIRFDVSGGRAVALSIRDGSLRVDAARVA